MRTDITTWTSPGQTARTSVPASRPSSQIARPGQLHNPGRSLVHAVRRREVHSALAEQTFALIHVRALHANDDGHRDSQFLDRCDHALRQDVAAENTAENVDE